MYRSPADRLPCSVCGDASDESGCSDEASGWRACGRCWNRAVGRGEKSHVAQGILIALCVAGAAFEVWRFASH